MIDLASSMNLVEKSYSEYEHSFADKDCAESNITIEHDGCTWLGPDDSVALWMRHGRSIDTSLPGVSF